MKREFLTVKEIAARYKVSVRSVFGWIAGYYMCHGKQVRYDRVFPRPLGGGMNRGPGRWCGKLIFDADEVDRYFRGA